MMQSDAYQSTQSVTPDRDVKGSILAVLMAFVIGGLFPYFSYVSRPSTWGMWIAICVIIGLFFRERNIGRLVSPVGPYLLWLFCFITWGIIVAPIPIINDAIRATSITLIIYLAMAILTSQMRYLELFANATQWVVFVNLLSLPMTMYSSTIQRIVAIVTQRTDAFEFGVSRFAGLWGNPNMAGFVCLVALILSIWAKPWLAWLGRLSAVPIIVLAASRKSVLLLIAVLILNVIIVQRHHGKRIFVASLAFISGLGLLILSDGVMRRTEAQMEDIPIISRLMDVTEQDTAEAGRETRADLFQQWSKVVSSAPWYGYGFGAMAGGADSSGRIVRKNLLQLGTHNTYLGILIEVGPLGFVTFLLLMVYYCKKYLIFKGPPQVRWGLLSLMLCNVVILFLSHNHLFSFEGSTAFGMFFLLPSCPALLNSRFVAY